MCDSGRIESATSPALNGATSRTVATLLVMLPWVSIAPLGLPVVPEV
jgi:hypothetical protein